MVIGEHKCLLKNPRQRREEGEQIGFAQGISLSLSLSLSLSHKENGAKADNPISLQRHEENLLWPALLSVKWKGGK